MFSIFKKKQQPTCKKCGMIAVGLDASGLCSVCGKDTTVNTSIDNYNFLKAGICCVCWNKTASVDDYDLCSRCKETDITDSAAIFHITQLFGLRHKEMIDSYETAIIDAYNENDTDGMRTTAAEYKEKCYSMGTGGRIYIEKQINDLQRREYDKDTVGYALRIALTGDDLQP